MDKSFGRGGQEIGRNRLDLRIQSQLKLLLSRIRRLNSQNSARKFVKLGKVFTFLIHQNVSEFPRDVYRILHSTPFVHSPSDTVRCIFSILQPQGKLKRMKKEPQSTPLEKSNISLSATRGSRSGILILAIFIADLKSTYSKGSESNQRKPIPLTNLPCTL